MLYCCEECFPSLYLKEIIVSNKIKGDCNFCGSKGAFVFDPKDLSLIFGNILDLYKIDRDGDIIEKKLDTDFPEKVFSLKVAGKRKALLNSIFGSHIEIYKDKLNLKISLDDNLISDEKLVNTRLSLSNEIKNINRFHIKETLDKKVLENIFKRLTAIKQKGEVFFRSRKSDKEGYPAKHLTKPPKKDSKDGRANPKGISYLYLSNDEDTTFHEVRATSMNYITVGTFQLKEDIQLIDLRDDSYNDIMQLSDTEDLADFLKTKPFIQRLDFDLSKPYNHNGKELDYLPTQYISEFIKSLKYQGIIYNSSLNPDGYNLVIFNGDEFECIDAKVVNIKNIKFTSEKVT